MKTVLFAAAVAALAGGASAAIETWSNSASFTTDFNNPVANISIPSFDTTGDRQLNSVTVTWCWSGSVDIAGDNDDDFKTAAVRARMVRTFSGTGPGAFAFGNKTITTEIAELETDNGDDGLLDTSGPDGVAFGTLAFGPEVSGVNNPSTALYATNGAGNIVFSATSVLMVNDQQFEGDAPDQWQLEVQNPLMTVEVKVEYSYTIVPAPGALALLGVGGLVAGRRRR